MTSLTLLVMTSAPDHHWHQVTSTQFISSKYVIIIIYYHLQTQSQFKIWRYEVFKTKSCFDTCGQINWKLNQLNDTDICRFSIDNKQLECFSKSKYVWFILSVFFLKYTPSPNFKKNNILLYMYYCLHGWMKNEWMSLKAQQEQSSYSESLCKEVRSSPAGATKSWVRGKTNE